MSFSFFFFTDLNSFIDQAVMSDVTFDSQPLSSSVPGLSRGGQSKPVVGADKTRGPFLEGPEKFSGLSRNGPQVSTVSTLC